MKRKTRTAQLAADRFTRFLARDSRASASVFVIEGRGWRNAGVRLRSPTMKPPPVASSIRFRMYVPRKPCFACAVARLF